MKKEKKIKKAIKSRVDLNPTLDDVHEGLSIMQRIKRSKVMKRYAKKIHKKRDLVLKRAAGQDRLERRSKKSARMAVKDKFSSGANSFSEKSRVEKIADKKKGLIQRMAQRGIKVKRMVDFNRRMGVKEEVDIDVLSLIENFNPEMSYVDFVDGIVDESILEEIRSLDGRDLAYMEALAYMCQLVEEGGNRHSVDHYALETTKVFDGLNRKQLIEDFERIIVDSENE